MLTLEVKTTREINLVVCTVFICPEDLRLTESDVCWSGHLRGLSSSQLIWELRWKMWLIQMLHESWEDFGRLYNNMRALIITKYPSTLKKLNNSENNDEIFTNILMKFDRDTSGLEVVAACNSAIVRHWKFNLPESSVCKMWLSLGWNKFN